MKVYKLLSKLVSVRKYPLKFLSYAIVLINVPLVLILGFMIYDNFENITPRSLIYITFIFTSISTGLVLIILNSLMKPFILTKEFV